MQGPELQQPVGARMEWKVKIRSDGTRYMQRPVRDRLLPDVRSRSAERKRRDHGRRRRERAEDGALPGARRRGSSTW